MAEREKLLYTLITGSSSGIGLSLALECASRRMNLALVSLPGTGLAQRAEEIAQRYSVDVKYLEIDLTGNDAPEKVYNWCTDSNIEVNFLVNNAGLAGTVNFPLTSPEYTDNRIQLNVRALALLCRYFIPMLERNSKSYILNVGSMSAFFPIPFKSVYSATKAFVLSFSQSLAAELKPKGIMVSVVCPNGVDTNEATAARIGAHKQWGEWTKIDSRLLARYAIDQTIKEKKVIIPKAINRFLLILSKVMPSTIKMAVLKREFSKEQSSL